MLKKVNSFHLEVLKRHAKETNDESLLWLIERSEKAELYEQALTEIVEIGRRTFRTESEVIAEKALLESFLPALNKER